jgi:hypothetical protein
MTESSHVTRPAVDTARRFAALGMGPRRPDSRPSLNSGAEVTIGVVPTMCAVDVWSADLG